MEIKFKAKQIATQEWVEGYYTIHGHCGLIHPFDSTPSKIVDPKTVCQFTGLKDKNGEDIYLADLIQIRNFIYEIRFEKGSFVLYNLHNGTRWGLLSRLYDSDMSEFSKGFSVIGNIFDNPELLNKWKKKLTTYLKR